MGTRFNINYDDGLAVVDNTIFKDPEFPFESFRTHRRSHYLPRRPKIGEEYSFTVVCNVYPKLDQAYLAVALLQCHVDAVMWDVPDPSQGPRVLEIDLTCHHITLE